MRVVPLDGRETRGRAAGVDGVGLGRLCVVHQQHRIAAQAIVRSIHQGQHRLGRHSRIKCVATLAENAFRDLRALRTH